MANRLGRRLGLTLLQVDEGDQAPDDPGGEHDGLGFAQLGEFLKDDQTIGKDENHQTDIAHPMSGEIEGRRGIGGQGQIRHQPDDTGQHQRDGAALHHGDLDGVGSSDKPVRKVRLVKARD